MITFDWARGNLVGKVIVKKAVHDADEKSRLELRFRWKGNERRSFMSFHSLAWQTNSANDWRDHLVISEREFQGSWPFDRSISDIAAIDAHGNAILKIAEANAPIGAPVPFTFVYSWREWNLFSNAEVKTIRVLTNAFEPL